MSLGSRLRELREVAGLSQDQIASIAGVSRNAVSQWESDRTRPATSRLNLIARALNVGVEDLVAPNSEMRSKLLDMAIKMLDSPGADDLTMEAICAAAGIPQVDCDLMFDSKESLLLESFRILEERKIDEIFRSPPIYGTLATRLKYLLRQFYIHDLAHLNLTRAIQSLSWTWSDARERERSRQLLRIHELIISMFDDAAAQGQIDSGNYRAASSLILASYQLGLRKAMFEVSDPDRIITFLEPQITIILRGFGFRIVPGLAEDGGGSRFEPD